MPEPPSGLNPLYLSEQRFQAIFDAVNDGILIQDIETGAMLDANPRICEWLGLSQQEILATDLGSLGLGLWPYTREVALDWTLKAIQGQPQTFEWLCPAQGGQLVWMDVNMRRTPIGGVDRLLITASNITQRKRTEMEANARLKRAEAQNAVSLALAGVGPDYAAALKLIAQHLAATLGDLCVLALLGSDGLLHAEVVSQSYIGGEPFLPDQASLPALAPGGEETPATVAGRVAATGRALRLEHATWKEVQNLMVPAFHPYLEHFRAHSLLAVPMRTEGNTIGTITLVKGGSSRAYSVEDQAALQNLADRAALTLTNARLYAENLAQAQQLRQANLELERRVKERTAELARANAKLQDMAMQDGLTGLANRRHFDATLLKEIRRARRNGESLALLLSDVDFFKRFNDRYGHLAGDGCLKAVAEVMRQVFRRADDLPARYGGEEFAVIIPGATPEQAACSAEMLRKAVEAREIPHEDSPIGPFVTISAGLVVAQVTPETTPAWFIARADEALYSSKANGRNRVTQSS